MICSGSARHPADWRSPPDQWGRWIVDQQHYADARELLKRRGQQRGADDFGILGVRRNDHGQTRIRAIEVLVDVRARHTLMIARAVHGTLSSDQIHQRRERQQ